MQQQTEPPALFLPSFALDNERYRHRVDSGAGGDLICSGRRAIPPTRKHRLADTSRFLLGNITFAMGGAFDWLGQRQEWPERLRERSNRGTCHVGLNPPAY